MGSLREEFDLLDAPFADRGARADDALVALRASLSQEQPAYHGRHYDFEGFVVRPCALQARVPLWVGGRTRRSLRRAVALADGWAPFGVSAAQVADWLAGVELPDAFEVVVSRSGLSTRATAHRRARTRSGRWPRRERPSSPPASCTTRWRITSSSSRR